MEFTKRVIGESKSGQASVVCLTTTAERFGWDKAFEEWTPRTRVRPDGSRVIYPGMLESHRYFPGGDRLLICTSKSTKASPRGQTFAFRMQGDWSRKHLVALAVAAGENFEWMETAYHERLSREEWQALA